MKRYILVKKPDEGVMRKEVDCIRSGIHIYIHLDENNKRCYNVSHASGHLLYSFTNEVVKADVISLYNRLEKLKWVDFLVDPASIHKKRPLKRHGEFMANLRLQFALWKEGLRKTEGIKPNNKKEKGERK